MKELSLKEFQTVSIDILVAIDKFCRENSIKYSMAYGSLIGLIRHKGFIPWDDDIDIVMPRPDYERFIRSFNGAYDNYKVISPELNWSYYAPYANVYDVRTKLIEPRNDYHNIEMGVKVDIFPLDGVPDDENLCIEQIDTSVKYNKILSVKRRPLKYCLKQSVLYTIKVICGKLLFAYRSYESIQKANYKNATKFLYDQSQYVDVVVDNFSPGTRHRRSCYDNYIDLPFENNYVFMVASGYDEILKSIFGDYMKLPPVEQQITNHDFIAYWK